MNPIVEVSIDCEPDKGKGRDSPIPGTIFTETQLLVLHLNIAGQFFCTVVGDIEIVAVPFGGGGGGWFTIIVTLDDADPPGPVAVIE